jgi:hypothetical protein
MEKIVAGRRIAFLITLAAALLGAWALRVPTASARRPHCSAKHAHTLASSRRVRVYRVGGRYYGCLRRSGRTILLTEDEANPDDAFELDVSEMTLSGTWVAWIEASFDASISSSIEIRAEDLRTRHKRDVVDDSIDGADRVVVGSHGALAWLAPDLAPSYRLPDSPTAIAPPRPGGPASLVVLGEQAVWSLASHGDGTFSTPARVAPVATVDPLLDFTIHRTIAASDLDGDGIADLAVPTQGGVTILPGRAGGRFAPARAVALAGGTEQLAIGDLNRDGRPDLVACGLTTVSVVLGQGGLAFAPPSLRHSAKPCRGVTIGDVTGDGIPDVLVAIGFSLTLLRGDGTGALAAPTQLAGATAALAPAIADMNRDGTPDLVLVTSENRVGVMLGRGGGAFAKPLESKGKAATPSLAVGDVTGDGIPDVVAGLRDTGGLMVLDGRRDGTLAKPRLLNAYGDEEAIGLADLNGDGKLDIAAADNVSGDVFAFRNEGGGRFRPLAHAWDIYVPHGKHARELVHAARLDRRSLRFRGDTLVWRAGGKRMSAHVR